MKKRIIFSSYDDMHNCYYGGGGAYSVHEVSRRLASKYEILIITGNYHGAENMVKDGVVYKHIGPSFAGPRLGQLLFHLLLPFYVIRENYDIWIESFTPPFSTSCLQLFTKKPVIGLVHMLAGKDMKRKYKIPFDLVEKIGLKTYKRFIVLTDLMKKEVTKVNPKAEITLIPNGVILQKQQQALKKNKTPYLLFMGRLEYNQKGLDLLIAAYRAIAKKTNSKLIIAGTGLSQDLKQIKIQIQKYRLEKKILLVGKVTGKKKTELFQNCSAVVVSSRFETFSMAALEAMSYGKPLVGFDIEGLQWIPKESMLKAKTFDVRQFGKFMQLVVNDSKQAAKMSSASQKFVKAYSWDAIQKKYEKEIKKSVAI